MEKRVEALKLVPGTEKQLLKAAPKKPKRSSDKTQEVVDLLMEVCRKKSHLMKGEKVAVPKSVGPEGAYIGMKLDVPSSKRKGAAHVPPSQHLA